MGFSSLGNAPPCECVLIEQQVCTVLPTVCTVLPTVCTVLPTVCTVLPTVCTVLLTLCTVLPTVCTVLPTVYTVLPTYVLCYLRIYCVTYVLRPFVVQLKVILHYGCSLI